ncbi:MAG: LETM1-related biofilm-associated protein [Flavobacteriaceae bacterium]
MNPSANGWITKLLKTISENQEFNNQSEAALYCSLRDSGFLYGNNKSLIISFIESQDLTDEEMSKVNLFLALYFTHHKSESKLKFLESIITFYKSIDVYKSSFFSSVFSSKISNGLLEKIIHKRVQIDDNILIKNFNYFVINALLYVDILAYKEFLVNDYISVDYIKKLEASIEKIVLDALNAKIEKTKFDESLIKLFESSLRYQDNTTISHDEAITNLTTKHEKWYLFDIACMSTWSDKIIDEKEQLFLFNLGKELALSEDIIKNSIHSVNSFYTKYKDSIDLLSSRNIVKNFYDNSSKMVSKLVSRNKKRLQKEIQQSKELMVLISQSTVRDLSKEESKQLQEQLLDIIKTIPSLAIFMLPGGAILLPLFVKLIPKLLPSAFDDNRIED